MKNQYFGDKRDIVKWSILDHIACRYEIRSIMQVALFRPDDVAGFKENRKQIFLNGQELEHKYISNDIFNFFLGYKQNNDKADISHIKQLEGSLSSKANIVVCTQLFNDRDSYFKYVSNEIVKQIELHERIIAFIDPDTGIEPDTRFDFSHVTIEEIMMIFSLLSGGSILVVYQHARHESGWVEASRQKCVEAVGSSICVDTYSSPYAHDVVFYVAQK